MTSTTPEKAQVDDRPSERPNGGAGERPIDRSGERPGERPTDRSGYRPGRLETTLTAACRAGRKLLVPYVTGGMDDEWLLTVEALAGAGADAIEVGIPFSDPMIDGPVIQEASLRALERGTTPDGILADLSRVDVGVPIVVMTYYNLIYRAGHTRIAGLMAESGVTGAIIPDLPLEELGPWAGAADEAGVATVLLVAPSTPADRIEAVCRRSRGFVYTVGRMGVTGEQKTLAGSARAVAERVTVATDLPVCVGIGVSTPEQAAEVCEVADGVVVGSALVRRLLEGSGPDGAAEFVGSLRRALDAR
jgi:tryptophan synthase alpha chain